MTPEQKIQLADTIQNLLSQFATSEDYPIMVGTLDKAIGMNGFHPALVGHPVFEYKDRYLVYLKSSNELKEKVYDQQTQQFTTKIGFFNVAVPYYKENLKDCINFTL